MVLLWNHFRRLFRGRLTGAKQARDGRGIPIAFMGYGEDKMESKLRGVRDKLRRRKEVENVRQVVGPGSGTARA